VTVQKNSKVLLYTTVNSKHCNVKLWLTVNKNEAKNKNLLKLTVKTKNCLSCLEQRQQQQQAGGSDGGGKMRLWTAATTAPVVASREYEPSMVIAHHRPSTAIAPVACGR
jgi:hypothetical protein